MNLLRRFDALFDDRGSVRAICLLRLFIGPIVLLHLKPFLQMVIAGEWYGQFFYDPWVSWFPEAPRELWQLVIVLAAVCGVLLSLGVRTRIIAPLTLALIAYNFFHSETYFRHNRQFLMLFLGGLSLMDSGRMYSVDAWLRRRRTAEPPAEDDRLWPLYLWRFLAAAPYFASGFSKLIDPDWWNGIVTMDRVNRYRWNAEQAGVPPEVMDFMSSAGFHEWFGKVAIFTELFICTALWFRKTRYAAIFVALCFHASIEVSAQVQVFSYLGMLGALIWVVPSVRDLKLELRVDRRAGRAIRWLVRWLDWLARFDVRELRGEGPAVALTDRAGRRVEGSRAARVVLSRLPVLAPPLLPTLFPGTARIFDAFGRRAFG